MKLKGLWPWLTIALVAGITLALGLAARTIRIEGGTIFLPATHPVERRIAEMERTFGSSEIMTVMMRQAQETIFTPASLELIAEITSRLEAVRGVEEVSSITNTDFMSGKDGQLSVGKLMPFVPESIAGAEEVKERALSWEMYRGLLFSSDMKATQWVVTLRSSPDASESHTSTVNEIERIVSRYESPTRQFMLAGEVAVKALLVSGITRDLTYLLPVLLVILIAILYLAFRNAAGVLLPLATVAMSTLWTVGLMALCGVPINIMGTAIPLLLVTVGSAYGIHFLSHYFEEIHANPRSRENGSMLRRTLRKVGLPILLAGVTTIAGFGSLGSASVPAILDMGIFTAFGVLCALALTFSFVPAVLTIAHRVKHRRRGSGLPVGSDGPARSEAPLEGEALAESEAPPAGAAREKIRTKRERPTAVSFLTAVYAFFAKRPRLLLLLLAITVTFAGVGISRIRIGEPTVDFFRPGSPVRAAASFADRSFGGSTLMYVVIRPAASPPAEEQGSLTDHAAAQPGVPGQALSSGEAAFASFGDLAAMKVAPAPRRATGESVIDPRVLIAVQGLERDLTSRFPGGVGRVTSLVAMIEQMNRVMHDGDASYYEIPSNPARYGLPDEAALRRLVAQYLLLYSGNLRSFVDSTDSPTAMRIIVQTTDSHPSFLAAVKREIDAYGRAHLDPLGYRATTVGLPDEMLAMNEAIIRSQIISVSLALLCVFIATWLAYRSFRVGLIGLVPIALSLLLNFAAMGFLGIPLDIVTAIIASVAIGIGIDYSIHVVSAYELAYRATGNAGEAARRTLRLTGRAILFNVASVTVGFAVLVFSMFTPLDSVGILMGVIMVTSSFFSLTLLPVLLGGVVSRDRRKT